MAKRKKKRINKEQIVGFRLENEEFAQFREEAALKGVSASSMLRLLVLAVNSGKYSPIT